MKHLLIVLSIRLFAYVPGCASSRQATSPPQPTPVVYNYVTPCDSKLESATNEGYQEGFSQGRTIGMSDGRTIGYQEGYRAGRTDGYTTGHAVGADSVISILKKLKDPSYDPTVILYFQGILGDIATMKHNIEQDALARGKDLGERNAYARGYLDGYERAFDSLFDARVQHGQMVEYPNSTTRISVDYKKVAILLHQINGSDQFIEAAAFSEALWEIHSEILRGLTIVLHTTPDETAEVMERYQNIHQSLSDEYYQQYRNRCKTEIREYTKEFYDYRYYHSVDAFFDIVESGLCLVADMAFTYAKNSHAYGTSQGFKIMGNICEILIGNVMIPVRDYTLKYGIMRDFEQNLPRMANTVRNILDSTIAEIRTHKKNITANVQLSSGVTAVVSMEIETQLAIGFNVNSFQYTTDHNNQELTASMSSAPRLLKVLKQDYKVTNVEYLITCNYPPCSSKVTLSNEVLQAVFEKYKDHPQTLEESKRPIQKNVNEILIPIIIKVAEPALALPHSCYNLIFKYSEDQPKELVRIECDNASSSN